MINLPKTESNITESKNYFEQHSFSSKLFIEKWLKHHTKSKTQYIFKSISTINGFIKTKYPHVYMSLGRSISYGQIYKVNENETDYKKKVFVIKEVNTYLNNSQFNDEHKKLKCFILKGYDGYMINLGEYENAISYLRTQLNSKKISQLRNSQIKLQNDYKITHKVFDKFISKREHDFLFKKFEVLLKKRYGEKNMNVDFLQPDKWSFTKESSFDLINEGKAALSVIYNNEIPISISLNYFSDVIFFGGIIVFDNEYKKYNLGYLSIKMLIDWCINNKFKVFDLGRMSLRYKQKWGNIKYSSDTYILFDSSSVRANIMSLVMISSKVLIDLIRRGN